MRDTEVFDGKSLTELLHDIHDATLSKRTTIKDIVHSLRDKMNTVDDMVMLAPIIKEYLDVLVRSDEHLVKIATIVQRIISAESFKKGGGDVEDVLTEEEREQLLRDALGELKEEAAKLDQLNAGPLPATGSAG